MARPVSNDDASLTPRTAFDGPTLTFDFPGMLIGVAEYDEGPTGCTVFLFPDGVATVLDERGGMVGKIGDYDWNHAICLAGGSLPGLEAAGGGAAELFAQHDFALDKFPLVSGAIIFDYGSRANRIYPDKALGRAAVRAARPGLFPLGRRGAGRSAGCGGVFGRERSETSGQGAAFREVGATKIGVFSVVNALGAIVDRQGLVVRGNMDGAAGVHRRPDEDLEERLATGETTDPRRENTTLTVVVTNQKVSNYSLRQLARQVHSSMARAIQPFHTVRDGDLLFAVTTNAVENDQLRDPLLGMVASELAWDAVLRCFEGSSA